MATTVGAGLELEPRTRKTKSGDQNSPLGLACGYQGSKVLGPSSATFPDKEQTHGCEAEKPGLKLAF